MVSLYKNNLSDRWLTLWQHYISFHRSKTKTKCYSVFSVMENSNVFKPPESVRGMKVLDRDAFKKTLKASYLEVERVKVNMLKKVLKKYLLKLNNVENKDEINSKYKFWLDPSLAKSFSDFNEDVRGTLQELGISSDNIVESSINLTYQNFNAETLLKAVLPKDEPPLTSFSIIGHIIHLNIKEHLLDYKHLIAQILLDKVKQAKTVLYKKNIIDNTYRNFEMEILCGEPNCITEVVEYGTKFAFDFSKVYWNPRLSTEHDRIVNLLTSQDALFDVFAGVGPFAVRAAMKKCLVFANDLNPDSYKWLNHNIKLNKRSVDYITTFNKDGSDFIVSDSKRNLLKIWKDEDFKGRIHFVMNLPACALTFLKYFRGLITRNDLEHENLKKRIEMCLPIIHCYFFVKDPETEVSVFERDSQLKYDANLHKFHYVRGVSTAKHMYRVTFELPMDVLVFANHELYEPVAKKLCMD